MIKLIPIYSILLLCLACQPQSNSTEKNTTTQKQRDSSTVQNSVVTLSDYFIKTYHGDIEGKYPVEIVLFNSADGNLNGYYQHEEIDQAIAISGEIDLDESFILEEDVIGAEKKSGWFEGSIADPAVLKGFWTDAKTKKTYPFELKEKPLDDPNAWTGTWHYNDIWDGGLLVVGNVQAGSFDFALDFDRRGHLGSLFDKAVINGNTATFKSTAFDEEACVLVFTKHSKEIEIDQQSPNFVCGFGARANASGTYSDRVIVEKPSFSYGASGDVFETKEQHEAFKTLVGKHYEDIAFNFQTVEKLPIESGDIPNSKAFAAYVMGAISVQESFIMYTDDGKFWVASLADDGTAETRLIRYFTTESGQRNTVPATLKKWLIDFGPHALVRE